MLAEYLTEQADWLQMMPGVRVCPFALHKGLLSRSVRRSSPDIEVLFCLSGSMTLVRRDGSTLTASARQVLLIADPSDWREISVDAPVEGILVTVDAPNARDSLQTIGSLLGGLTPDMERVRRRLADHGGCAVEGCTYWSQAVFADLDRLPRGERARWCVWKSVELLYLRSAPTGTAAQAASTLERNVVRALMDTHQYMEEHLDEPLTIPTLSRRACLSATTFKEGFRRLYGLPVHAWLRQRRMARAAELLRDSSLSVLAVAQSVGYGSASQFTAAFRRQYGMVPTVYRKNV